MISNFNLKAALVIGVISFSFVPVHSQAASSSLTTQPLKPTDNSAALEYDAKLTSLSQILAGIKPDEKGYERFTDTDSWKAHHSFFTKEWAKMKKNRLLPVIKWREGELKIKAPAKATLMYPFSGPDFLNAHSFFPDCDSYIFYSLEASGQLPDIEKMSDVEFADLLQDIRDSLGDIFKRHYFITKAMNSDFRTPYLKGNLSVFMVFMALTQSKIISIEKVILTKEGKVELPAAVASSPKPISGIKITFTNNELKKKQTLYYYSVDISDKSLEKKPEFSLYIESLKPTVTLLKAASYLLHGPYFLQTRKLIMDVSESIIQDDSGVPYRFFQPEEWNVKLFGRYTKPIKDFDYGFQEDLETLYKDEKSIHRLPFKFGYHWWDNYSNLMVASKGAPPQKPTEPTTKN